MKLNKKAFKRLIDEDIAAVKMHFPISVDKLEMDHIIRILEDSVDFYYPN